MQVEPASNLGALRSGLPASPKNKLQAVEGLNHLFQHCNTGLSSEYPNIEETISPEVLEMMAHWLEDFISL